MTSVSLAQPEIIQPSRITLFLRYLRRNKGLTIGLFILLLLVVFTVYWALFLLTLGGSWIPRSKVFVRY